MIRFLLKLLGFYLLAFGCVGMLIQLSENLFNWQDRGDFFNHVSALNYVSAFFITPVYGLISFFTAIFRGRVFAPDVIEVHVIMIVFFLLATLGFLKHSRFILFVAALLPVSQAILVLDLVSYIQVK